MAALRPIVRDLSDAGIRVSLFLAPDPRQLDAAAELGAAVVELHTGTYCDAYRENPALYAEEGRRIVAAADHGAALGLEMHAGHGLTYETVPLVASLPAMRELNIGHFLIGEAVFVGLGGAIAEMRRHMSEARAAAEAKAGGAP
jgi:pyridoxine 5-phosphate synthase